MMSKTLMGRVLAVCLVGFLIQCGTGVGNPTSIFDNSPFRPKLDDFVDLRHYYEQSLVNLESNGKNCADLDFFSSLQDFEQAKMCFWGHHSGASSCKDTYYFMDLNDMQNNERLMVFIHGLPSCEVEAIAISSDADYFIGTTIRSCTSSDESYNSDAEPFSVCGLIAN